MKNQDKPIHPVTESDIERAEKYPDNMCLGLSKREYFAGLAMQGILSKKFDSRNENVRETVYDAIEYADELLKELEK